MKPAQPRLVKETLTYAIDRLVYSGSMSEVYEAHRLGVNGFRKKVALKFMNEKMAQHTEMLNNFIGESKLVADLIHPNIGQIYNLGFYEGRFFIAMEYINGVTLEQFVLQHVDLGRSIPAEKAIFAISRIARGLSYAHTRRDDFDQPLGLVHRDVNPHNVMISFEGEVKLVDFGVAKAHHYMADNEEQFIAGKLDYMSPEQIAFKRTDFRSDIFSTTVVLAELLTGEKLFTARSFSQARKQILAFRPEELIERHAEVFADERLRAVLIQGLAPDSQDRFENTRELFISLERLLYSEGYGPTTESMAEYLAELFPHRQEIRELGHDNPTVIVDK